MIRSLLNALLIISLTANMLHPIKCNVEPSVESASVVIEEPIEMDIVKVDPVPESVIHPEVIEEVTEPIEEEVVELEAPEYSLSEEEINLLALVTMAEAEGESEYGKRLVIDVILNRADHEWSYWPDTVTEVIYQKDQFTSMWNGRSDRCYVREDIVQLVKEELTNRTNSGVVYFRTKKYSKYGTPAFKEGNHYFSTF